MKDPITLWAWVSVDQDGNRRICQRDGKCLTSFRKEELDKRTIETEFRWQAARARSTVQLMQFTQVDTVRIIVPPARPIAVPRPRPIRMVVNGDTRADLMEGYLKLSVKPFRKGG